MKNTLLLLIVLAVAWIQLHSQDISSNLEAYLTLDCTPLDITGNGHDGQLQSEPQCIDGKLGNAYDFDGLDDYILLEKTNSEKLVATGGFTWALWFKADNLPSSDEDGIGQTLISFSDESPSKDIILGFGSLFTQMKQLTFQTDGSAGFAESMLSPLTHEPSGGFDNDTWYHLAGVRDYTGNEVILYLNGEEVDKTTFNGSPFTDNLNISIGASFDGTTEGGFFDGVIDEVRFYARVLTPNEVLALFSINPDQLEAATQNLDFGVLLCAPQTVEELRLYNNGPSDFTIVGTELSVGEEFEVLNGGNFVIQNETEYMLQIRYMPSAKGTHRDTLTILNQVGIPPLQVFLEGTKDSIEYSISISNAIDFGIVCPSETKDTVFTLTSDFDSPAKFSGKITGPFIFLDSALAVSSPALDARESRDIPIRFAGDANVGEYTGELTILDACGNSNVVQLSADVYLPELIVEAGTDTTICPQTTITRRIKISNTGTKETKYYISSSNPFFEFPESVTIAGINSEIVEYEFTSGDAGGVITTDITIDAGCAGDTTITLAVNVTDIQISQSNEVINIGEIVLCNPDTLVEYKFSITNVNITGRPLNVTHVDISNPVITATISVGTSFEAGITREFTATIKPNSPGDLSGDIVITFDSCDVTRTISIIGEATELHTQYLEKYNFGKVVNGDTRDTTVYFINTGTTTILLNSVADPGAPFQLTGTEPEVPGSLEPGDTLKMFVHYEAIGGLKTGEIIINTSTACGQEGYEIQLSGEGSFLARIKISIPAVTEAEPGSRIALPIYLDEGIDIDSAKVRALSVDIAINPTMMLPVNKNQIKSYSDGKLILDLELDLRARLPGALIDTIPFNVLLGNAVEDSISITNVYPINGLAEITSTGGVLRLFNLCDEDGTRLFEAVHQLILTKNKPNPAVDFTVVEFEVIEKGRTQLYIIDEFGNKIIVVLEQHLEAGSYSVRINTSSLSSGIYFYVLETPTQRISGKMMVVK